MYEIYLKLTQLSEFSFGLYITFIWSIFYIPYIPYHFYIPCVPYPFILRKCVYNNTAILLNLVGYHPDDSLLGAPHLYQVISCSLSKDNCKTHSPNSENFLDLSFAASRCEKVIFVPDTTKSHLQSENSCWICKVLVASKTRPFNMSTKGLRACETMCFKLGKN